MITNRGIRGLPLLRFLFGRRILGWLALAVMIAVCSTFWWMAEPKHEGIPLSQWLDRYASDIPSASQAVLQIGPEAVPMLTRMIATRKRSGMLPLALQRLGIEAGSADYASIQRRRAVIGFEILRETGAPAVPALAALVEDPECGRAAAEALRAIGDPAEPIIRASLASTNEAVKRNAVRAVRSLRAGKEADELFAFTTNSDPVIRSEAFLHLPGGVRRLKHQVWEAILRGLNDPDPLVRSRAIIALRIIGDLGTNGLPKLYRMTNSADRLVAAEVALSIKNLEKRMRLRRSEELRNLER